MDTFTIQAADGRQLEALTAGPPDGRPLFLHNGTPVGLVVPAAVVAAAADRGLRIVSCARPGYQRSTPRPGRRVADVAEDVATVLDSLGMDRFITLGWSGGGPHALACAALLPGRCLAAATMAGVAPYRAEGLDWLAGMGPENVAEFRAAASGEAELTGLLEQAAGDLRTVGAAQVIEALGGLIDQADAAVLAGEFAGYLAAGFRAAVSSGIAGWRDDDLAFVSDWGFSMAQAGSCAPVSVWQGGEDRMVPWEHGKWLAANIPGARAHLLPGEGHLTLVSKVGEILADLTDLADWD